MGLLPGVLPQGFLPLGPVVLGIHIDPDMAFHIPVHSVVAQMLDRVQRVAAAADQVAQIFAFQLHMVSIVLTLGSMRNSLRAHVLQQALQELLDLLLHRAGLGRSVDLGLLGSLGGLDLGLTGLLLLGSCRLFGLGGLGLGSLGLGLSLGSLGLLHRGSSLRLIGAGSSAQSALGLLHNRRGVGDLIGHLDLGHLGTKAQETGLGLLQDLDRNAVPIQTQLGQSRLNGQINGLSRGDKGLFHFLYSSVD